MARKAPGEPCPNASYRARPCTRTESPITIASARADSDYYYDCSSTCTYNHDYSCSGSNDDNYVNDYNYDSSGCPCAASIVVSDRHP